MPCRLLRRTPGRETFANWNMCSNGRGFWPKIGRRSPSARSNSEIQSSNAENFLIRPPRFWPHPCCLAWQTHITRGRAPKGTRGMEITTQLSDQLARYLDMSSLELKLTAQNMANANTPGYTLEIPNWQENDPVTINGQSYGEGAEVTGGVSQRDRVLEQELQQQNQTASSSAARLSALDQLQDIFNQPTTSDTSSSSDSTTGIGQDLTGFFDSLSSLESDPSDNSLRQGVLSSATTLAGDFQSASSQLTSQQGALDQQTVTLVSQVNALSQSIAQLNQQIQSSDPKTDAGTLEDQRQEDIQQLSQLIGVHQIQTEDNGLTLTTSSGALLVSEGRSYALTTGPL